MYGTRGASDWRPTCVALGTRLQFDSDIDIRGYAADNETALIALWNATMWSDPIDAVTWRTRFLLDPNFLCDTCLVATLPDGEIVGFVLGMFDWAWANPIRADSEAWIVGFGVREQHRRRGVARTLFDQLEWLWRASGVCRVTIGPYIPSYVTPGIDEAAYPEAVRFAAAWGAATQSRPLSMKASLTGYRSAVTPDRVGALGSAGIRIRPMTPVDILPLLTFLERHFPHWRADAASVLSELYGSDPRAVTMHVAEDGGRIIGYAQSRSERFGPFGVDEAYRGRGVGAALLSTTLLVMRARGYHAAWFLWTSDRAAKLYREHGFEEVRRFAMMSKTLG